MDKGLDALCEQLGIELAEGPREEGAVEMRLLPVTASAVVEEEDVGLSRILHRRQELRFGEGFGQPSDVIDQGTAVDVCIDTDLISAGTTWLEIFIKNGNNSSYKGTLMQKITVVEYGAIEIEKAKKTVVVDVSDFASEGDVYNMRFFDNDYIDGGDSAKFVDCTAIVTDGKLVFEFDYALMHKYNIGLNKGDVYDFENLLGIMQSVNGGVNDVYDGYSVYGLMFWTADSIELEAYIKK